MKTKKILQLALLCVSLHLLASDAAKIVGTAAGVGAVYGLVRGASQVKICPDIADEGIERLKQENPEFPVELVKPFVLLGFCIGGVVDGAKVGLLVGVPLAFAARAGSLQPLNVHDVIKPLSLGFGAVWCASMVGAKMGYSAAYRNYACANKIMDQKRKYTWPRRDEADQDEQLKCKSSRLAALWGSTCFAGVGIYGLAIGLTGWAYYKRCQSL